MSASKRRQRVFAVSSRNHLILCLSAAGLRTGWLGEDSSPCLSDTHGGLSGDGARWHSPQTQSTNTNMFALCQAGLLLTRTRLKSNNPLLSVNELTALLLLLYKRKSFEFHYNFHKETERLPMVCQRNSSPLQSLHKVSFISSSTRQQKRL